MKVLVHRPAPQLYLSSISSLCLQEIWRGKVEQLSWEPRAFLFHNFLSDEECDHLIELAEGKLKKSTVVNSKTGGSMDSEVRTSFGTFLQTHQDDVVTRIEKRLGHVTMIPEENGESLQILRYQNGQKYEPHTDYFHDQVNQEKSKGGQRIATVLMYLSTPEEGGETVFPSATTKVSGPEWSECALQGLAVKSVKGNALMFYSLKPDGTEDPRSLHGSCPVSNTKKESYFIFCCCELNLFIYFSTAKVLIYIFLLFGRDSSPPAFCLKEV